MRWFRLIDLAGSELGVVEKREVIVEGEAVSPRVGGRAVVVEV